MIGIPYVAKIPSFARDIAADEVLCRVSAPSTGILLVTSAWFGQQSGSAINENSSIAFVRLSTDGSGGATMTFEEPMEAAPAFPGSGAALDADGWTQPTVSGNPFHERVFNLANEWQWAALSEDDYIVVPPSARIGLRLLVSPAASMTWRGGLSLLYIGS